MKKTLAIAALALFAVTLAAFAQTSRDDQEPALLTFQGRVGGMYTGGDPFENGAAFEVGTMIRFTGPIYFHIFGGITNFDKEGDILPITPEFADTLEGLQVDNEITDINRLNYKMNFFGAGLGVIQDLGPLEVHLNAGAGAYELSFVADFDLFPRGVPDDIPDGLRDALTTFLSLEDKEWLYGFTVGGGLYYDFNEIISFGGHMNYHNIDTEAIDNPISFTFGMHIKVP